MAATQEFVDHQARADAAAAMAFAERVEDVTATKLDHLKELSTQTLVRIGGIETTLASIQNKEGALKLKMATGGIVILLSVSGVLFTKVMGW